MSRYIEPTEDSPPYTNFVVDLAPFPTHFTMEGRAIFPESFRKDALRMANRIVRPELVVYATGYTQGFELLDKDGGYSTPGETDMRNVTREGDESVAFIGFVRPGVGEFVALQETSILVLTLLQVPYPLSQRCSHSFGYLYSRAKLKCHSHHRITSYFSKMMHAYSTAWTIRLIWVHWQRT